MNENKEQEGGGRERGSEGGVYPVIPQLLSTDKPTTLV